MVTKANQVIVFNNILANMGGAYNASTGKFTAPRDGIYYFSWNVLKTSKLFQHIILTVDGASRFFSMRPGTQSYEIITGSLFLQLKKGNEVWLRAGQAGLKLHGHIHSSFSGFMF